MATLTLPRLVAAPPRHRAARRSVRAWLRGIARTATVQNALTGAMVGGLLVFGLVLVGGL